ncbi:phosphoprotein [Potato yellow dwarf virus]|uniref:Phosphoprotein n=2 Tax=Alphanucleorhabdovirus tuberosum TaxID=2749927 RepID=A8VSQ3_9RHAB|nr:phosphoprotein [Potato yellow dwarf virus]ABW35155.1 phosphoprotein [Potato yellow dwarf virus]ADE45270.1 phosphoprotein [Potato yellow dwarf virus]QYA72294.1 phosphoprotein [Alphanucleorhabdovirus tuberosum]
MSGHDISPSRKLRDRHPSKPLARSAPYDPVKQAKYKKQVLEGNKYEDFNPQSLTDIKNDSNPPIMAPVNPEGTKFSELCQMLKEQGNTVSDSVIRPLWDATPKGQTTEENDDAVKAAVGWFNLGQTNLETQINLQNMRYAQTSLPNFVSGLANTASALTSVVQKLENVLPSLEKSYHINSMSEADKINLALSIYKNKNQGEKYRMISDFLVNELGYSEFYNDMMSPHYKNFALQQLRTVTPEIVAAVSCFGLHNFPSLKDRMLQAQKTLRDAISGRMTEN